MPNENPNDQAGLGSSYTQPIEKYDSEHGKYVHNIPPEPNLPNAGNAGGADPSPFKIGGGK